MQLFRASIVVLGQPYDVRVEPSVPFREHVYLHKLTVRAGEAHGRNLAQQGELSRQRNFEEQHLPHMKLLEGIWITDSSITKMTFRYTMVKFSAAIL